MRIKFIIICCMLVSCSQQNYLSTPKTLQEAITACTKQTVISNRCMKIKETADSINNLIMEISTDPQNYGKNILNLQTQLSKKFSKNLAHELKLRLLVVKWFLSPGARK